MNVKVQYYFMVAAETCNFSKAAKKLYISQTALSKIISGMEEELGEKLFIRNKNVTELTDAGKVYLEYARKAGLLYQDSRQIIRESIKEKGTLRMGLPVLNDSFMNILSMFHRKYPDAHVRLYSNQISAEAFSDSKLDMILIPEDKAENLKYVHIATREGLYAVMNQNHRLAGNPILDLEDLQEEQLIFGIDQNGRLDEAYQYSVEAGLKAPHVAFLYNDAKYQLNLILNSDAVAISSNLFRMFRESMDGIVTVPININIPLNSRLVLAYRPESRNPLVPEMAECAARFMEIRTKSGI